MATLNHNLSELHTGTIPSGAGTRIGLVVSEWNQEVTGKLEVGAIDTLLSHHVDLHDIIISRVPGSFELPFGAQILFESTQLDAIILLGCVIQGETRHFDFICQGVTQGAIEVQLKYNKPVIFGILTTENQQQALDRSGGIHGNKGIEAAMTALKMVSLQRNSLKK